MFECNAAMVCGSTQVDIMWLDLACSEASASAIVTLPHTSAPARTFLHCAVYQLEMEEWLTVHGNGTMERRDRKP